MERPAARNLQPLTSKISRPGIAAQRRRRLRWWIASIGCGLCGVLSTPALKAAVDRALPFLEARVESDPDDFVAWNQLADRYLVQLRDTGDDAWLDRAARAADASLKAIGEKANPGGLAVRARVDLASHRFAAARDRAQRLCDLDPGKPSSRAILVDALLELGDLEAAAHALDALADLPGGGFYFDSRRARLALARGRLEEARDHFSTARDAALELGPSALPIVAWSELQLGELAFRTGDWESAEARYQAALGALPGWWPIREHLAELRGAQGRTEEALKLYAEVIAQAPRPELLQAVGDLHLFLGQKEEARSWHDRALAAYRRVTEQGSVAYFHHLAGFCCDSQPDPAEAVKWARQDLELRQSAGAYDVLAWALYQNGDFSAAAEAIGKALAPGGKDAHILYHAGLIRMSAGDLAGGQSALREAAAVNPRFQSFHAHR
ncbi:MAG: hypothetical protein QOE70_2799 [Chthoniobacter sp.]|jgi:tetratricopeptide (TPR) repeat protein|nr:hypothetical protein [Chthoniobacter sp.]